jgi:Putative peptidoglycan binding domain
MAASHDPANPSGAIWIQSWLNQLGFFSTQPNGLWDADSRRALRDFKVLNGLPANDVWDALTERKVVSASVVRQNQTFVGGWSSSPGCTVRRPDDAPLVINVGRASSDGGNCDFYNVAANGAGWKVRGRCAVGSKIWTANIKMVVENDQLVWTSEKGTARYFRCKQI